MCSPSNSISSGTGVRAAPSLCCIRDEAANLTGLSRGAWSLVKVWDESLVKELCFRRTGLSCLGSGLVRRVQMWGSVSSELRAISRHHWISTRTSGSLGSDSEKWWEYCACVGVCGWWGGERRKGGGGRGVGGDEGEHLPGKEEGKRRRGGRKKVGRPVSYMN